MTRPPLRVWLTPLVLVAAVLAVVAYARAGDLTSREAALLSAESLGRRAGEHLRLAGAATALAVVVAIPAGVAATRPSAAWTRRPLLFVANLGQTVPTLAVLALMFTVTGVGFRTALVALWAYSLLPVLRNTMAGLATVDPAVSEAAQGVGMSARGVLTRVELPLAWPVILAGVRTATVVNVGTAALATYVGAGGLGAVIEVGIVLQADRVLFAGAALTAIAALAADWVVATAGGAFGYDAARPTRSRRTSP